MTLPPNRQALSSGSNSGHGIMMKIISGMAKGIVLETPRGLEVRPTAVRARGSLMDSIFDWDGLRIADLCAGSGAVGLEAASRGAAEVLFVENNSAHCRIIENNAGKIIKSGAHFDYKIIRADILNPLSYTFYMPVPDIIFADPPYHESLRLFTALMGNSDFKKWSMTATLIWELPDQKGCSGMFLTAAPSERPIRIRSMGSASFIFVDKP